MFTPSSNFSQNDLKRLNKTLDEIYLDFTQKVATDRNLSLENVQKVAKGRVWSGEDAKRIGLVDHLGGLNMAVDHVKKVMDTSSSTIIKLVTYPSPEDPITNLINILKKTSTPLVTQGTILNILNLLTVFNNYTNNLYIWNSHWPLTYSDPITVK